MKCHLWMIWLLLTIGICPRAVAETRDLVIYTEENPPVNFTENGRLTGSSVAVVREICRRLNWQGTIRAVPWARGYSQLISQPNVALFSTARTEERERMFHWVGPLYRTRAGFYALKSRGYRFDSLAEIRKVGAIATYKDDVREQILKASGFTNLDSSKSPVSNLKKLVAGRVDLWFYSDFGMTQIAQRAGVDPRQLDLVYVFREYDGYIALSRGVPDGMVGRWQKTLDQMKRDGTFQRLSLQWLSAENLPDERRGNERRDGTLQRLSIYTENNPPGNYLENGRPVGFVVDIVQEIIDRMDRPESIEMVPWARGYKLALSRPNVALFSTSRLPQRESHFLWVGPVYTQQWGFYAKKGSGITIGSLDDAKHVARIGTYHDDAKKQFLERRGFDNLVSSNINISNIKHLISGEIDLWVSSDLNMPYIAWQAGIDPGRVELVYPFRSVDNYIAFSVGTAVEIVSNWQRVLDELKRDGTYDKIKNRYLTFPRTP